MKKIPLTGVIAGLTLILVASQAEAVQFARPARTVRFSESSFDKMVFDQLNEQAARNRCNTMLKVRIDLIGKGAKLTVQQTEKLRLAGQVDIHRFFARYALIKRGLTFGTIDRDDWQQRFAQAQIKVQPLRQQYSQGLHGGESLFEKSRLTVLDRDQNESVRQMYADRQRARYTNDIRMALSIIDRKVPLTKDQRTTITELLLAKTSPPDPQSNSSARVFSVLGTMSEIEDDLAGVFSNYEWIVVRQLIEAGNRAAEARRNQ